MAERIGVLYAEITGDLTRLTRAIAQSDEKLKRFSKFAKGEAELTLDKDRLDAAIKEGEAKLARLEKKRRRADFDLDVRGTEVAEVEIATVQAQLDTLRDKRVQIELDVDRSALDRIQQALAGGILGGAAAGGLAGGGRGGGTPRGLLAFIGGTGGSGKFISALGGHSLPVLTGAAIAAEGALGALAAAAVGLGASLAPLAGTLAAFPGLLSGLGQLGGSLFATFSGIGDAVKAQGAVTTKSVVDSTAALERERASTEAVRGAKLSLSNAQRQATDAQTALTLARKDATRTLEDMKNRARDAALAESGAALSLREAQSELRKVSSDPESSMLDIERAQLGIKVARQAAREARQEAQRAKSDSDKAQRGGVDKTPQVVAARKQLADANRSVAESSRQLASAQAQAATRTDKLSSSQQKLNETMAKLSPSGRQFVRFLGSLRPAFRSIRNASQEAALPNFQKGIEGAMKNLPTFRQQLTNTSRVLGTAGKNFGKFVGGEGFGKDFQIIARANNNVMRNLGRALIPLTKAFNDIGVAAAPFTRWLGRAVLHLARLAAHSAKAGRASGGLASFLRRTRTVLEELSKATANLVGGLGGLFKAAFPQGRGFLELLTRITGRFDQWANSVKGQNSIKKFMEDQEGPLKAVGEALVSVIRLIKDLASAPGGGEGLKLFARATKLFADALDFLARIPGVGTVLANMALLAVVAGRFGRLGPAIAGLRELAAGIRGVAAADAASGGLRGFGLRIRTMLSTLGKTRIGETIAGNIAAGLGVGAIKIRAALDRVKGIMRRVLQSAGIGAGQAAADSVASNIPVGMRTREGKLKGFFGRLGNRLGTGMGRALALGVVAGFVLIAPSVFKVIDKFVQEHFGKGGKLGEFTRDTFGKLLPEIKKGEQGPLLKLLGINEAKKGVKELKDDITGVTDQSLLRKVPLRDVRQPRRPSRDRAPTPSRTKTVEIQTPVLSLSAKTVEKSMNRIQTVLRRELGQARSLIARQVGRWDEVFEGFRLLRGDDPLHLGSGIRRSAEDARKALRAIVNSLGSVLERLSSLARIEGREVGSQLAKGLGDNSAVRAAERLRMGVVQEFSKMKRQSGVEVQDMVSNLRATFSRLPEVVSRSTSEMLKIVLTAMRALGATGRGRIVSAVDKIEGKAKGGFIKKARGGYIPGSGLEDTVPLQLPPGSVIENRHQQPVIDFALRMAQRMGFAMGGRVPVLAAPGERVRLPSEIPHVQRALALTAAQGIQPFSSLEQVFGTIQRPHYLAEGGQVPSATQTVARKFVGEAPQPPAITQKVIQRFAKGGNVRGIVPIPGQPGESIHSSIVKQVVSLMRRYKGRVTDGYAPSGHKAAGEHPKGLAIDVIPGAGGSWDQIDKLASWAEPSQGSPRAPFRWVGYNQDAGHGRGNHLHLSWGGDGGSIEMTPRVRTRVKGPGGAAKELVGAAVKKVQGASNRKLRSAEGVLSASGAVGKGGPLGKPTANMRLGRRLMRRRFSDKEWPALRTLWQGESGWKTTADNPSSSAYGIPQALPGSKMRSAGKDWETNPATQIKWGLGYIKQRYGTPSKALAAWRGRSPHWYAQGGFVGRSFARGGRVAKTLSRLPGGGTLTKALTKYDDLIGEYTTVGQQLKGLQSGGTVQTTFGKAPTLGSSESYVLRGRVVKPGPGFLKSPRSGKRKKDKKPGKGRRARPTPMLAGVVEDFNLQPYTGTFADAVMPGLLAGVDSLIDPQLEGLIEDYTTAENLADASDEEYVVTEDKLGKSVAPFIDQTAVKRRLGELDTQIRLKSLIAGKMQSIVAAVEYAIQLLVNGVRRRQEAVKAIELKVRQNKAEIDDLEDKLDRDGGGGINRAITLLEKEGSLSENAEKRVKTIWKKVFGQGESPPMHTSGKHRGDIAEGKALKRLRDVQGRYLGRRNNLIKRNDQLAGEDGLKSQVIENSTGVWEPNIETMGDHLTTYRGRGGGWLAFDPFSAGSVDDISKLQPPADAGQVAAYKPFTGALGEALWTLERNSHPFPEGSLIAERAELLQQSPGGVLDTLLKRAQAGSSVASPAQDIKNFLASIADLLKNFGSNVIPLKKFAKGGISRLPLALVGEEGPEIVRLPPGSRVHSNPESERMAKQMGIPGFREGGVIQPPTDTSPSSPDMRKFIKQLVEALEKGGKVVNVDARQTYNRDPEDRHQNARALKFEVEAALGGSI